MAKDEPEETAPNGELRSPKANLIVMAVCLLLVLIWFLFFRPPGTFFVETFDKGTRGWLVKGDAQDASEEPDHVPDGGNPGAHLTATDDAVGGVWYWDAPKRFRERISAIFRKHEAEKLKADGASLVFDIKQSHTDNPFDDEDVIAASGKRELYFKVEKPPTLTWTSYKVPLDPARWIDVSSGQAPDPATFDSVFSDLDRLWIRGEYRTGEDIGGIDNAGIR